MESNNSQSTNYWINSLIITLNCALYKPTQRYFFNFIVGAILTCGTVADWIRVTHQQERYRKVYNQVHRFGDCNQCVQCQFTYWTFETILPLLPEMTQFILACDDTPIKRYGNKIEGADWQFHESNGNRDCDMFYGHSLVVISLIVEHPQFGTISLPLTNRIYVPEKELDNIPEEDRPDFKTKLQQLNEMIKQIVRHLKPYKKPIILLFDRGYVSQEVFEEMKNQGVEIITRFKSNTNFYRVLLPTTEVKRGRPRKYGEKLKLSDIIDDNDEFPIRSMEVQMYGRKVIMEYKTCNLTSRVSDGRTLKVVISRFFNYYFTSTDEMIQEETDWGVFVSTDLNFSESFILEQYSRRFSIEEMFKDLKTVCGLGKQQVRTFHSNIATYDLTLMSYTLVEFWAWNKPSSELVQHRAIWDDQNRRPSHKDKRFAMQQELKWQELLRLYPENLNPEIIQHIKNTFIEYALCP